MTEIDYTFKICLVGDSQVGKTTFIKRHKTGEFEKKYVTTFGVEVHPLDFCTNYGVVRFNVWDTAGQEQFRWLRKDYYIQSDGSIIIFDVTNRLSYQNVEEWYDNVTDIIGSKNVPIILCGNKVDTRGRHVKPGHIKFHREKGLKYYDISAKNNFNLEKPFLELARQLTGHEDLQFVEHLAIEPPTVQLDAELIDQYEKELEEAIQQQEWTPKR